MRLTLVAALLLLVFAAGCSKNGGAETEPTPTFEARPAVTPEVGAQTERQRPPADIAPVTAPAAAAVLAQGDALSFKVCSQRTGWQKPDAGEMAQVFTDRRFGDGVAPDPGAYTIYLTPFYFPVPFAASANKYTTAFGGFWDNSGVLEQFCDREAMRRQGLWYEFTAIDFRAVDVRLKGSDMVVVVEPGFDGWQNIVYPYPPDPRLLNAGPVITSRQVVDTSGRLLWQELLPANGAAWQQSQQYSEDGGLQALVIGGILPYASAPITISPGQAPLRLYSSSPPQAIVPGSLRVLDAAGRVVARLDWQAGGGWQALGTLALGPGTYRLLFADQRSDWHHFVLLGADAPLPPGVE